VHSDLILVIVIATAIAFDFTNGFHDTANVVATSISTRAVPPRVAVAVAALLNFVGALISLKVAATVGKGFVDSGAVTTTIVFAGLVGAIAWNLATWYFGLPSSSSHALIGGLVGAVVAADGWSHVNGDGLLSKLIVPAVVSPLLAFAVAALGITLVYRIVGRLRPGPVKRSFRLGQIASGGLLALSHGTNDAQKTMGIMTLALIAHGSLKAKGFHVPTWVVLSAASAIALGTFTGGWRIIRTMGTRIIRMDVAQGFAAQSAGSAVILAASGAGYPLSTTHVISGGIMGAGAAKRLSAVRWGVAGNIVAAWVLTLPAAAAIGALAYGVTRVFGTGALGPLLVFVSMLTLLTALFGRRLAASGRRPRAGDRDERLAAAASAR
jgi:PiT family inorganic phosphate transporter